MSDLTVTIVGTGVIGTSLGLALKQIEEAPRLIAHDKDLSVSKAAVQRGAFDKADWNLINACDQADVIILAMPLSGIRPTMEVIADDLKQGVLISDTCRSKAPVLQIMSDLLPDHAHFVGGDPIVHPAGLGPENAREDLFQGHAYCLTPSPSANEDVGQFWVNLVGAIGAEAFFLDAAEHDGLVTAVEYLPAVVSCTLLNSLSTQTSWRESRKMAGGLFEQVSTGATGDPDSLAESLQSNRQSLLHWLDNYQDHLNQLRALLAEDDLEALAQHLDKAFVERHNWLTDYKKNRFSDPELTKTEIETPGLMKRLVGFGR
ncbi:MAG: prephenate dehydrogenase [Chloroflexota bacterium]